MTETTEPAEIPQTPVVDMRIRELRYDDWGRPIGLKWPERPEDPEAETRAQKKNRRNGHNGGAGGRPPQEFCKKGLHKMDEWGAPTGKSDGGRYCRACKNEWARARRQKKREEEQAKKEAASRNKDVA